MSDTSTDARHGWEEMDDGPYGDLTDPIFRMTEDDIVRDLVEAEADIKAGRVVAGEIVLAGLRKKLAEHLEKGHAGDDVPVDPGR